jgi:hypothetical protein
MIASTRSQSSDKLGRSALSDHLKTVGIQPVDYDGWLRIKAKEDAAANAQRPRLKVHTIEEMMSRVGYPD